MNIKNETPEQKKKRVEEFDKKFHDLEWWDNANYSDGKNGKELPPFEQEYLENLKKELAKTAV